MLFNNRKHGRPTPGTTTDSPVLLPSKETTPNTGGQREKHEQRGTVYVRLRQWRFPAHPRVIGPTTYSISPFLLKKRPHRQRAAEPPRLRAHPRSPCSICARHYYPLIYRWRQLKWSVHRLFILYKKRKHSVLRLSFSRSFWAQPKLPLGSLWHQHTKSSVGPTDCMWSKKIQIGPIVFEKSREKDRGFFFNRDIEGKKPFFTAIPKRLDRFSPNLLRWCRTGIAKKLDIFWKKLLILIFLVDLFIHMQKEFWFYLHWF